MFLENHEPPGAQRASEPTEEVDGIGLQLEELLAEPMVENRSH